MKKFISLLFALLLAVVCSTAAFAGESPAFTYKLHLTDQNGAEIMNLRALKSGDTVNVKITLDRTDIAGESYDAYGVEFKVKSEGLQYNGDGAAFRQGTTVNSIWYSSGLVTGVTYLDLSLVGETVADPLEVCSWSYTVEDPAAARAVVTTAIVYVTGNEESCRPIGTFTLKLDPKGGKIDGTDISGTYETGETVTLPAAKRSGYTFEGWSDGKTVYATGDVYTVYATGVLEAVWEKTEEPGGGGGGGVPSIKFELELEMDGGSTSGKNPEGKYTEGTVITLPEAQKDGYIFVGWTDGKTTWSAGAKYEIVRDVTLTAVWRKISDSVLNSIDHIAYIRGYEDGTVRPDGKITRAEVATMLYRVLTAERRDEIFTADNSFDDLSRNLWYNKAVSSMAKGGYISGYPDGTFGGDRNITRAEFVTVIVRLTGAKEGEKSFPDVAKAHWASGYVSAAASAGWISGYPDGTFRPDASISRAEAITIMNRVLERGVDGESVLGNYTKFKDNADSGKWYYYDVLEATNDHAYVGSRPSEDWTANRVDYVYDAEKYEKP